MEHYLELAFLERFPRFLLMVRDTSAKPHPYGIRREATRFLGGKCEILEAMLVLHPSYFSALCFNAAKRPTVRWKLIGILKPLSPWEEAPKPL